MKGNKSNILLNNIKKREFILSPTVSSGKDRECSKKDFIQETNNLSFLGKFGNGIKVNHRETKVPYSIKVLPKDKIIKANLQKKINKILELMYKSAHPYLIRLLNHYEDEDNLYLIIEASGDQSLYSKLSNTPNDETLLKYFIEVLIGVKHLQTFGMVNININPDLILVDDDNLVKMTDYGINMSNNSTNPRQTFNLTNGTAINSYTSPEELSAITKKSKLTLTEKKDSWNLGVLLYELFSHGNAPFKGTTMDQFVQNIFNCKVDLSLIKNPNIKQLITKLLVVDEQKRMSINELIHYDYFKSVEVDVPEVESGDNIINAPEENPIIKQIANLGTNYDYDSMMASLQTENGELKKVLEKYRESELMWNDEMNKSSLMNNYKQSMIEGVEYSLNNVKNIEDNNGETDLSKTMTLTESDILNKERMLEDKIRLLSPEEVEIDEDVKLNSKIRQLENQIELLKSNYDEEKYRNIQLETQIMQLEQDNIILEEKLKVNSCEIDESKSSELKNKDDMLKNTFKSFEESVTSFKEITESLLNLSKKEHKSLSDKSYKYLDNKEQLLFEMFKKINEKPNNSDKKMDINSFDCKKTQINELIEYKATLKEFEIKDQKLNNKLRLTKEKYQLNEKMNNILIMKNEEYEIINKKLDKDNKDYRDIFDKIKTFVDKNISSKYPNFKRDFYFKFKI